MDGRKREKYYNYNKRDFEVRTEEGGGEIKGDEEEEERVVKRRSKTKNTNKK